MKNTKSEKILIVADNDQVSRMVKREKPSSSLCPLRVPNCRKALQIASRHPSFFDVLLTDIDNHQVDDEDFATKFNKLSPRTKVVYMIP